jgi:hypothetical protein
LGANERQVGGDHYRKHGGEQHWDRQWRLHGPGYFIGCITKYVERYREKNGLEDLRKAQHFLEKLIELEGANAEKEPPDGSSGGKSRGCEVPPAGTKRMVVTVKPGPDLIAYCDTCRGFAHSRDGGLVESPEGWRCSHCGSTLWWRKDVKSEPPPLPDQYCCDCGNAYPGIELEAGFIYCEKCRGLPRNRHYRRPPTTSPQKTPGGDLGLGPVCECGAGYPKEDLLNGFINCPTCREKKGSKL